MFIMIVNCPISILLKFVILSFLVVIEASFGSIMNLSEGTLVYEISKIVNIVRDKQKF